MNPWITAADLFTLIAGFVLLLPHGEVIKHSAPTDVPTVRPTVSEQLVPIDLITAATTASDSEVGQQHQRLSITANGAVTLDGQAFATVTAACAAIDGGVVVLAIDEQAPFVLAGNAMQALAGRARVVMATEE